MERGLPAAASAGCTRLPALAGNLASLQFIVTDLLSLKLALPCAQALEFLLPRVAA